MTMLKALSLAVLAGTVWSVPVTQQTVLSPSSVEVLDSEELILRVNTTFDAVKLKDKPFESLETYGYLDFKNYQIFDPKAAADAGKLNGSDVDCAVTAPNALLLKHQNQTAPFIFESNATALAHLNVSHYFDFVSLAIKPLARKTGFISATLNAWTIKDGGVEKVDPLYIGFVPSDGVSIFETWVLEPRAYVEGWGEGANFIELGEGEDEDGHPVSFCVDNIVVEYHYKTDDN